MNKEIREMFTKSQQEMIARNKRAIKQQKFEKVVVYATIVYIIVSVVWFVR